MAIGSGWVDGSWIDAAWVNGAWEGADTQVDVPLDTIAMVDFAPALSTGVTVQVPLDTFGMTDLVPTISADLGGAAGPALFLRRRRR